MNKAHEIEARLDRSLRNQIRAPQLGQDFAAGVWSRIEAQQTRATNPGESAFEDLRPRRANVASRWLLISNLVGGLVAVVVMLVFGLRAFSGSQLEVSAEIPSSLLARVDPVTVLAAVGYLIAIGVVVFGFSLTSAGRRLRAQFS